MSESALKRWLLADLQVPSAESAPEHAEEQHAWWRVMCLTGVDYFSTLGYQPGIAFLAAGVLSPVATLVLVLVTLFAALPVYRRVAKASPNGQGSIAMMENLFPAWGGKLFVLVLLGFATTDFVITMTLSAADAANHFIHNPLAPTWMRSQMGMTLLLLGILGAIFLKGFNEAINIAVVLVGAYLLLNGVVTLVALRDVLAHPALLPTWRQALFAQHGSLWRMAGAAALVFPQLALGLSGFETGVAVMPLVQSSSEQERIANTRKLLVTAAVIMSVFLIFTSLVSTLLIPARDFADGGPANGRAMAFLAHRYMGQGFGSVYDASTILILAFAGASAMAGLLNLIPRYLPRYGMAPEWSRANRPLVLVFMLVATVVTLAFHANVDAQGGAYATGVLVLMTSGSVAVTLSSRGRWNKTAMAAIALIFIYTTLMNIRERPEGLKIATFFILTILFFSLVSRATRATELRIEELKLDALAEELLREDPERPIRLIAINPRHLGQHNRDEQVVQVRLLHGLPPEEELLFIEVERGDSSDFTKALCFQGRREGAHGILSTRSPVVANAIAALLIDLGRRYRQQPHVYFHWTEITPVWNVLRFIFLGEGDTAPLTHEVLRRAIPDIGKRPVVHVA